MATLKNKKNVIVLTTGLFSNPSGDELINNSKYSNFESNQKINQVKRFSTISQQFDEYKDFKKIYGEEATLVCIKNLLTTISGTYIFDPNYGCNLIYKLFDMCDTVSQEQIKSEVYEKITKYVPNVIIKSVDVYFMENNKGFIVNVTIENDGNDSSISVPISMDLIEIVEET